VQRLLPCRGDRRVCEQPLCLVFERRPADPLLLFEEAGEEPPAEEGVRGVRLEELDRDLEIGLVGRHPERSGRQAEAAALDGRRGLHPREPLEGPFGEAGGAEPVPFELDLDRLGEPPAAEAVGGHPGLDLRPARHHQIAARAGHRASDLVVAVPGHLQLAHLAAAIAHQLLAGDERGLEIPVVDGEADRLRGRAGPVLDRELGGRRRRAAGRHLPRLGGPDRADQAIAVGSDLGEQRRQELLGRPHPPLVRLVRVHLDEHRRPLAEREVAARIARLADPGGEALRRIVRVAQVDVRTVRMASRRRPGERARQPRPQPGVDFRRELRRLRGAPGEHPVVVAAVGHVHVHDQMWAPGVDEREQRPGLGRGRLEEVAVQVGAVVGRAEAHPRARAVLARPVPGRDALVAVDVVDRHD